MPRSRKMLPYLTGSVKRRSVGKSALAEILRDSVVVDEALQLRASEWLEPAVVGEARVDHDIREDPQWRIEGYGW